MNQMSALGETVLTANEDSAQPLVTVVMPCYNVAGTVTDAVNSVLRQTYSNFELVLVNDGSTDGKTPGLCDSFCSDSRVRVIHQVNTGLAGARNAGLASARGDYVALLDSDDLYEPEKLARHVDHLASQPEVGLSFSYSRFLNELGKPLPLTQGNQVEGITPEDVLCRNPVGNGSTAVFRREVLEEVAKPAGSESEYEYFDTELRQSEDVEFWLRVIATTSWSIEGIAKPLTLYRLNSGGLSANTADQLASWELFLEKASGYAPSTVTQFGSYARAYQLRYLARRSVHSRSPLAAMVYMRDALLAEPRILLQEPARTLATAAAALGCVILVPFHRP